jgi:hypothetical protein
MFLDKPIRIFAFTLWFKLFSSSLPNKHSIDTLTRETEHHSIHSPKFSLHLSALYLSLTVNPFFTSTKSATPFPPSPLCNNRPSSSHFSLFLCMIHFQAKLNASLTVSPLDWTFITTFSYGDCYWFDFFFLSPFLILGFLVFCFCSTWLLCCVAPLKFTCEGVGRIREKGFRHLHRLIIGKSIFL